MSDEEEEELLEVVEVLGKITDTLLECAVELHFDTGEGYLNLKRRKEDKASWMMTRQVSPESKVEIITNGSDVCFPNLIDALEAWSLVREK